MNVRKMISAVKCGEERDLEKNAHIKHEILVRGVM